MTSSVFWCVGLVLVWSVLAGNGVSVFEHQTTIGDANFCCYYFYNESVAMFSHDYHTHYQQTTACQYTIDVKYPANLTNNCDLVLCIKNLNLDAGDFIKINHRDLQVTYAGDKTPNYPIRIWDHKVSFWFTSDRVDVNPAASWAISYKCLKRGVDHNLCNICDTLNAKAVLPQDEDTDWWRIWS